MAIDTIARGLANSAVRVTARHTFDTLSMRSSYFTLNPKDVKEGMYCIAGNQLYRYYGTEVPYDDGAWDNFTGMWRGGTGLTGATGTGIDSISDYDDNTIRITLDDPNGTYYDVSKTNAEAQNITVDKTNFANFLKAFTKSNLQELLEYIDLINENPSGIFYIGKMNEVNSWKVIKENSFLNFYRYDDYNSSYNYIAGFGSSVTSDRFILNDWAGSLVAQTPDGKYRTLIRPSIDKNGAVVGNTYGRISLLHDGNILSFYPENSVEKVGKFNNCTIAEGLAGAKTTNKVSLSVYTSNDACYSGFKNMILSGVSSPTTCRVWIDTNDGVTINESCSFMDFTNGFGTPVANGSNSINYREDFPLLKDQPVTINIEFDNPVNIYGTNLDLGYGNGVEFVPMLDYVYFEAIVENMASKEWVKENTPLTDSVTTNNSSVYASAKSVYSLSSIISALSAGSSPLIPITVEDFEKLQNGLNGQHYLFTNGGVANGKTIKARDHAYIIRNFEYSDTDYIIPDDYVVVESDAVSSSGVFITGITATDGKNANITWNDFPNEYTVKSVVADGASWLVNVVWDRNASSWTGGVPVVNGKQLTAFAYDGGGTFHGTVDLTSSDISNGSIIATLGEVSYEVPLSVEIPPVVQSIVVGGYPVGQTSVKEGDSVQITVTADAPFNKINVDNYQLGQFGSYSVPEGTSATITIHCAGRGLLTPTEQQVRAIVVSPTGSKSAAYTSVSGLLMDNSVPSLSISSISYPAGQEALKGSETSTIIFTPVKCDEIVISSPNSQLSFSGQTGTEVVATRMAGDYNISENNIHFALKLDSNGATASFDAVVNIANVSPLCNSVDVVYCKSPVTTDIPTTFSQKVKVNNVSLPKGTLVSAQTTAYSDSYILQVAAAHTDDHSNTGLDATFEIVGMSGIAATVTRPYGIRGFEQISLIATYPANLITLPTTIVNTANVIMAAYIDTAPIYEIGQVRVNSVAAIENVGQSYWYSGGNTIQFAPSNILGGFGYESGRHIVCQISESN